MKLLNLLQLGTWNNGLDRKNDKDYKQFNLILESENCLRIQFITADPSLFTNQTEADRKNAELFEEIAKELGQFKLYSNNTLTVRQDFSQDINSLIITKTGIGKLYDFILSSQDHECKSAIGTILNLLSLHKHSDKQSLKTALSALINSNVFYHIPSSKKDEPHYYCLTEDYANGASSKVFCDLFANAICVLLNKQLGFFSFKEIDFAQDKYLGMEINDANLNVFSTSLKTVGNATPSSPQAKKITTQRSRSELDHSTRSGSPVLVLPPVPKLDPEPISHDLETITSVSNGLSDKHAQPADANQTNTQPKSLLEKEKTMKFIDLMKKGILKFNDEEKGINYTQTISLAINENEQALFINIEIEPGKENDSQRIHMQLFDSIKLDLESTFKMTSPTDFIHESNKNQVRITSNGLMKLGNYCEKNSEDKQFIGPILDLVNLYSRMQNVVSAGVANLLKNKIILVNSDFNNQVPHKYYINPDLFDANNDELFKLFSSGLVRALNKSLAKSFQSKVEKVNDKQTRVVLISDKDNKQLLACINEPAAADHSLTATAPIASTGAVNSSPPVALEIQSTAHVPAAVVSGNGAAHVAGDEKKQSGSGSGIGAFLGSLIDAVSPLKVKKDNDKPKTDSANTSISSNRSFDSSEALPVPSDAPAIANFSSTNDSASATASAPKKIPPPIPSKEALEEAKSRKQNSTGSDIGSVPPSATSAEGTLLTAVAIGAPVTTGQTNSATTSEQQASLLEEQNAVAVNDKDLANPAKGSKVAPPVPSRENLEAAKERKRLSESMHLPPVTDSEKQAAVSVSKAPAVAPVMSTDAILPAIEPEKKTENAAPVPIVSAAAPTIPAEVTSTASTLTQEALDREVAALTASLDAPTSSAITSGAAAKQVPVAIKTTSTLPPASAIPLAEAVSKPPASSAASTINPYAVPANPTGAPANGFQFGQPESASNGGAPGSAHAITLGSSVPPTAKLPPIIQKKPAAASIQSNVISAGDPPPPPPSIYLPTINPVGSSSATTTSSSTSSAVATMPVTTSVTSTQAPAAVSPLTFLPPVQPPATTSTTSAAISSAAPRPAPASSGISSSTGASMSSSVAATSGPSRGVLSQSTSGFGAPSSPSANSAARATVASPQAKEAPTLLEQPRRATNNQSGNPASSSVSLSSPFPKVKSATLNLFLEGIDSVRDFATAKAHLDRLLFDVPVQPYAIKEAIRALIIEVFHHVKSGSPAENRHVIDELCDLFDYINQPNHKAKINIQKNPTLDWLFSRPNSDSWRSIVEYVRIQAIAQLFSDAESIHSFIPADKIKYLNDRRNKALFAEHTSNKFLATLGRTKAVEEIDKKINEYEQPRKTHIKRHSIG